MESVLKIIKRTTSTYERPNDNSQELINEIKDVCRQISCTERWFQAENDSDLIDACIHQREGLYAKYRYLMRKAKNDNLYAPPFEPKCI